MPAFSNNLTNPLTYNLTYAGIPFVVDEAVVVRMPFKHSEINPPDELLPPRKHQPETKLTEELKRIIDDLWLLDMDYPQGDPGQRNTDALAIQTRIGPGLGGQDTFKYNTWFYPVGARRWSVFRGLATSSQMKAMFNACIAGGVSLSLPNSWTPQTFVMQCIPADPISGTSYTITTQMYMLPPRPIGETAGEIDGLYLITLVDERYWWQYAPISASPVVGLPSTSTWTGLINFLGFTLGVNIGHSPINPIYGSGPEQDSQFWTNQENAALLLDAVAFNLGRTVVRNFDGSYLLLTNADSQVTVNLNRGVADNVVRTAGGDIFNSGGQLLPAGDISLSRTAIIPPSVNVTFPIYVQGDDPVPHFSNPRNINQRPSCWQEDSYGDAFIVNVPASSGGIFVSGLVGAVGPQIIGADPFQLIAGPVQAIQTTAKALVASEATDLAPLNISGLTALAMQLAGDYYANQTVAALDEVYPGTVAWQPDGIHDIVWTWSSKDRQGTTRVMRGEWNSYPKFFQHQTPAITGFSPTPRGVGGPSVAQSWTDSVSGVIVTPTLVQTLLSGQTQVFLSDVSTLPTQNKWRGFVGSEAILFEGTSGGISAGVGFLVSVRDRAIDGTLQGLIWPNGTAVVPTLPHAAYGINHVHCEKMQWAMPGTVTSGGVTSLNVIPQTQTIQCISTNPTVINGITYYAGVVQTYDTASPFNAYGNQETVWIRDRNDVVPTVGLFYGGQFAGFSASPGGGGGTAPVYLVDADLPTTTPGSPCGKLAAYNFGYVSLDPTNPTTVDTLLVTPWSKLSVDNTTGLSLTNPELCKIRIANSPPVPPGPGCYLLEACNVGTHVIRTWVQVCLPQDSYNFSAGGETQVLSPWGTLTADNTTGIFLRVGSKPCEIIAYADFSSSPPPVGVKPWEHYMGRDNANLIAGNPVAWYYGGSHGGATIATIQPVKDTLYAVPFVHTRAGTVDQMSIQITTGQAGLFRIGIYTNVADATPYPNSLLFQSPDNTTNFVGVTTVALVGGVKLTPGTLFWFVFECNVLNVSMNGLQYNAASVQPFPILGFHTAGAAQGNVGLTAAFVYAPLPATFPVGASLLTAATVPLMSVSFVA